MATSQLINKKIKALEATLKKKSNFKPSVVAKLETQLKNFQAELRKLTPKKSTAKKPSVLQKLKKMVKTKTNLKVYNQAVDKSGRKTDLVRDADRPALPTGRRVSKGTGANQYGKAVKGRVYYENRPNRIDVKQPPKKYPKLEEGGMMAKGGEVVPYIVWVSKDGNKRELFGEFKSKRSAEIQANKLWETGEYVELGFKPKSSYDKQGLWEKGGMMADGGMVFKKGDKVLLKDGGGQRTAIIVEDGYDSKNRVRVRPEGIPMDLSVPMDEKYSNDKRIYILHKMADGGMMAKGGFVVFNYTDNIHASNEVFKTKKEAKEFIENFRNRFNQQGYYRTSYGERIPTNQIDLEIIPEDFNPFKKMADGGMMAMGGKINFKFKVGDIIKVPQYDGGKLKKLSAEIVRTYSAKQNDGTYYPFYYVVGKWDNAKEMLYDEEKILEYGNKPTKMADGGMMAKGGGVEEKIRGGIKYVEGQELEWHDIMSFDIATYGEKEAERKAYDYIQENIKYWNGELNEDDFRVRKSSNGKDFKGSWVVMRQFPKYAEGGMMAKGGSVLERLKKAKEMGIKGYGKAKEYTKKQIHDQKKSIALDVIVDTLNDDYFDTKKGRKDIRAVRITEELVEEHYAKGGMTLDAIQRKYNSNEDKNYHSENVVLLAENFGTDEEKSEAKEILKRHNQEGSLSSELYKKRGILEEKLWDKFQKVKKMANSGMMAKGGMTEISDFKTNLMGTASFMLQLPNMRKPQEFIVYPIQESDNPIITIQSDTRIGKIDLSSGRGLMSESHASGAYFVHLQMDKKTPFQLNDMQLSELKLKIKSTGGKEVGSRGIVSDNSGALNIMEMGGKVQFKSHRLNN